MEDQSEFELLIEIAKQIKKYHPVWSDSLANCLSSPEFLERLVTILSSTDKEERKTQKIEKPPAEDNQKFKKSSSLPKVSTTVKIQEIQSLEGQQSLINTPPSFLKELEKTEPDKSVLLINFYNGLMAKTFLPTVLDIRTFASDTGLSPIKTTSRNKAIISLVKALLNLPVEKLKTKLDTVKPVSAQDDRSLEGWFNIILDKELRSKQED